MSKKTYTVTDRAGPKVAGQIAQKGEDLELTDDEAAQDLRDGAIVPKGETLHAAFTETTKKVAEAQAGAEPEEPAPPEESAGGTEPPAGDTGKPRKPPPSKND